MPESQWGTEGGRSTAGLVESRQQYWQGRKASSLAHQSVML